MALSGGLVLGAMGVMSYFGRVRIGNRLVASLGLRLDFHDTEVAMRSSLF